MEGNEQGHSEQFLLQQYGSSVSSTTYSYLEATEVHVPEERGVHACLCHFGQGQICFLKIWAVS